MFLGWILNIFKRVWNLKEEILQFLAMKDIKCDFTTEMKRKEWISDFAFAVETFAKENELNIKL